MKSKNSFMKISAIFLAVLLVASLCSCDVSLAGKPKITSLNFSTDARVSYKSYDLIDCKMVSVEDGPLTIDIEKPVLLSGLQIVCQNEGCTIKVGSLSYEADINQFPQVGFGNILRQSLILAKDSTEAEKNEDGTWTIKSQLESSHVELKIDGETGYPISLSIPEEEINVIFMNFTNKTEADTTQKTE